jgi:hypothetical protein
MEIQSAFEHENRLEVVVDEHRLWAGEKYSPFDLGYAFYFLIKKDEKWLHENGEVLPADPFESRGEMTSGNGRLITSNPILVALAINSYWYHEIYSIPKSVEIPSFSDAIEIVRNRTIMNKSNELWKGYLPGLEKIRSLHYSGQENREFNDIQEKDYSKFRTELINNFWGYHEKFFSTKPDHFDRSQKSANRPPVFHPQYAWENVILQTGASKNEISELMEMIPKGEFHKWFRSMNSSQALALSILGNLAIHKKLNVLSDLKEDDGELLFENTDLINDQFSMEQKIHHLGEPRSTSLDGFISGDYQVAIECKFTETEVGACSRPKLSSKAENYNRDYCNGSYSQQKHRKSNCSLTEIGVEYWNFIPELFNIRNENEFVLCPLNRNYQLFRNILAVGVRKDKTTSTENGHAILIYDERNPAFLQAGKGYISYYETKRALINQKMLRKISWQRIVKTLRFNNTLPWLTEGIEEKYRL